LQQFKQEPITIFVIQVFFQLFIVIVIQVFSLLFIVIIIKVFFQQAQFFYLCQKVIFIFVIRGHFQLVYWLLLFYLFKELQFLIQVIIVFFFLQLIVLIKGLLLYFHFSFSFFPLHFIVIIEGIMLMKNLLKPKSWIILANSIINYTI
jgi:hypothetical protein